LHIHLHLSPTLHTSLCYSFSLNDTATTEIYTLSLHDALPIWARSSSSAIAIWTISRSTSSPPAMRSTICPGSSSGRCSSASPRRSEEHTSELQSRRDLVCRLLLEKKKKKQIKNDALFITLKQI